MKEVESILNPIEDYLMSIKRNTMDGWYELQIGIPNSWVFDENNKIKCDVIEEFPTGKIIKIFPKSDTVVIDDLLAFVRIIILTNQKIAEKEEEFKAQMEEMKKGLEKRAGEFFKELDELKENSFKKLNDNFVDELSGVKKETRGRKPKDKSNSVSGFTETEIEKIVPAIKTDVSHTA
jgi:hypothetical protein